MNANKLLVWLLANALLCLSFYYQGKCDEREDSVNKMARMNIALSGNLIAENVKQMNCQSVPAVPSIEAVNCGS